MSYLDEDVRPVAVVNQAARQDEREKDDDWTVATAGDIKLAADAPDLHIIVGNRNRVYAYEVLDVAGNLGYRSCGRLPYHFDSHSCSLYATLRAMESISNSKALQRVCERYGYSTRTAARASLKRLKLVIRTPHHDLNELGQTFADNPDPVRLVACLRAEDRIRYEDFAKKIARFDCLFQPLAGRSAEVNALRSWAAWTMHNAEHNGPVQSKTFRLDVSA